MSCPLPVNRFLPLCLLALAACRAEAQVPPRPPGLPPVDVQDYAFEITLSDTTDEIAAQATVTLIPTDSSTHFWLDLVDVQPDGTGMRVLWVREKGVSVPFTHNASRLTVTPATPLVPGQQRAFVVSYGGVPGDGLIISQNKYGDRTFFGDNWPDRARHWLPVVDHPSDKATVTWDVTAPARLRVVANGRRVSESETGGARRAVYRSGVPIPAKVMVFGAAPFAVEVAGLVGGVPVESWVYPQNEKEGFYDYALAVPITAFFDSLVAPFPYEKLANVQSKTRYGGMENAGAIFYNEASVRGDRAAEGLLAHEIAHQWFGNHVTESDWPHLWLSEGFATYLTSVYFEKTQGVEKSRQMLREGRETVLGYYEENRDPLVDTTYADPNELLNPNAYQRGAWVLHMLRREVARAVERAQQEAMPGMNASGDDAFFEGLRRYVARYGGRTATTDSLQAVMEGAAGQSLDAFFRQWTRRSGHPVLRATWRFDGEALELTVAQTQPGDPFAFPLDIGLVDAVGDTTRLTLGVTGRQHRARIPAGQKPARVVLDPDVWLLFQQESVEEIR